MMAHESCGEEDRMLHVSPRGGGCLGVGGSQHSSVITHREVTYLQLDSPVCCVTYAADVVY